MAILILVALVLVGVTIALLLRAVVLPRVRMESRMRQIGTYGFDSNEPVSLPGLEEQPSRLSVFIEHAGRWCMRHLGILKPLGSRELLAAGIYERSAEAIHGWRVLAVLGLPTTVLLLAVAGGSLSPLTVLLTCLLAVIAWLLPLTAIRARGRRRLDRIDHALPELIDVLTATIEAGLGFAGSLALCAKRFDGPLGQELRFTLQEQTMGLSTNTALENMRERCDTPSVRAFVRAVSQGESLGVSIGTMMRNLATETRKRRRANAQERIQKAPIKMLFPLVFLIFPSLLIVLIYPAVHNVLTTLNSG